MPLPTWLDSTILTPIRDSTAAITFDISAFDPGDFFGQLAFLMRGMRKFKTQHRHQNASERSRFGTVMPV